MSTRSAKKSAPPSLGTPPETPKSKTGSPTSTESASSRMSARSSPLSPTRISRLQEKVELQNLNDRLAAYIDKVRSLEVENNRLSTQIETIQETMHKEVVSMKSLYEQELNDARKLIDDTAKERARIQIDVGKLKADNEDLRMKIYRKERDFASVDKSLTDAENKIADLTNKLNTAESDRKKLIAEVKDLRDEVSKLSRQLAEAKKQLESEVLTRVDLENRCQSLREDLDFKKQLYEKEISETKLRKQVEVSELDGCLKDEYEARLQDTLRELREQYEDQLRSNRGEIEGLYETKIEELNRKLNKTFSDADAAVTQLNDANSKVQDLSSRVSYLERTNESLQKRNADLEANLQKEREIHYNEMQLLKDEIERLQEQMATQLLEYQDLMDIKVALDLEIAAYRKLLEAEESRLNLAPSSPLSERGTPIRRTPMKSLKRKRTIFEEGSSSKASFHSTARSSSDLEILEDCPEGKFVKLKNTGDKDIPLGNVQIVRTAGQAETTFKFHRSSKLPGGETVAVWSSSTKAAHEPPLSYVMKHQNWAVADAMTTKLIDSEQKELAVRESKREKQSYSSFRELEGYPEYKNDDEGEERYHLYAWCILA